MRPRIRNVKPDIFHDEQLWALGEETRMPIYQGFQGLWCYADREGRFEWRPLALKSLILPYWGGDYGKLLEALVGAGMVVRYVVDGRTYGWVRTLTKHQALNQREPPSILPAPPRTCTHVHDTAPHVHDTAPHVHAGDGPPETNGGAHAEHGGIGIGIGIGIGVGDGSGIGERAPEPEPERATEQPEPTQPAPRAPQPAPVSALRSMRGGSGGVARTDSLPCEEPPREYLDEAVMRAVSREQAASTWKHYFGAGLPPGGVERLYPWLIQRAKERANKLAKLARASPMRGRNADALEYAFQQAVGEDP
jgi:hypothetical protein